MNGRVQRKDSLETLTVAFEWLTRNPILLVLFFVVGLVDALGEEILVFALLGFFLSLYAVGIAQLYARDEFEGRTPAFADSSSQVVSRMFSLIGISIIYAIVVFLGTLALILPGIYLGLRLLLAFPACVIDDQNAFDSLSTSWTVAKGNLLKLLGITLLVFITFFALVVALFVVFLVTPVDDGLESLVLVTIIGALAIAIILPTMMMAYARVYLENRERPTARPTEGIGGRGNPTDDWSGEPTTDWREESTDDRSGRSTDDWREDTDHGRNRGSDHE